MAYRWKTQINENAKQLAYAVELPEPTTTRSSAGSAPPTHGRFAAVFLDDADTHPRVKARIELTRRRSSTAGDRAACTASSRAARPPSSACSRSCCSATSSRCTWPSLRGVDPTPVPAIERLKTDLG